MTYQNPTPKHDDDVKVEEAELLLTGVTASRAPSFACGPGGGGVPPAAKKKKHGVPMIAVLATCCFLGTLAVIYDDGGRSTVNSGGSTAALFRRGGHYDPQHDSCFTDPETVDTYCWVYPTEIFPSGNWKKSEGGGYDNCGPRCSDDVYDPRQDFCFADTDNPGKYCWYYTDKLPYGNWKGEGGRGYDKCGGYCSAY